MIVNISISSSGGTVLQVHLVLRRSYILGCREKHFTSNLLTDAGFRCWEWTFHGDSSGTLGAPQSPTIYSEMVSLDTSTNIYNISRHREKDTLLVLSRALSSTRVVHDYSPAGVLRQGGVEEAARNPLQARLNFTSRLQRMGRQVPH